ncbi:hypothetical protein P154DRAFT_427807 [Amniculicola lignicola CBS 123094]|uniref:holo-[acyl-carrier-protein] synthase n=1 Tax=Amniculicola lignicola CBS 123094 TaxID=1392246 RepID=A0A6A5WQE5_9PLEO|nr:hypothetical protein P154DRAFT_427807 [Amniculicola lignicola CBS 123094]
MAENGDTANQRRLTCWMLDTRPLWPGRRITDSGTEALSLISTTERDTCTRKYHLADAKMSLASALLKRLFIHKTLGIPWDDVRYARKKDPQHGKPCAVYPNGRPAPVEFNVSHQAGLVVLIGCRTDTLSSSSSSSSSSSNITDPDPENATINGNPNPNPNPLFPIELGIDIVCVNERNDMRVINTEGFAAYIDMYAEIFSLEEIWDMKYNVDSFPLLDGTIVTPDMLGRFDRCCMRDQQLFATLPTGERRAFSSNILIDAKLRRFYTYWSYKEAYIKLDGEALLAKWIAELEFRNVRAPRAGVVARCSMHGVWGERLGDTEVWLKGRRLKDVGVEIVAFEEDYMVGVAVKPRQGLGEEVLDVEMLALEEVMESARAAAAEGK